MNTAQVAFLERCRELNTWAELVCLTYADAVTDQGSLYDARIQDLCEETLQEWYATYDPMHLKDMISGCRNQGFGFYGLCSAFRHYFNEYAEYVEQRKAATKVREWERQGPDKRYGLTETQVDAFLTTATRLLASNSFVELVNGLCLVTGRRPYEIGVLGQMRLHRNSLMHANQYCYFRRLAKTRNELRARQVLEIPVLVSPELVVTALRRLRTLHPMRTFDPRYARATLESLDRQYMNSKGSQLRRTCQIELAPIVPDLKKVVGYNLTPQSLRKVYEGIADAQWNHEGMAGPRWVAEILGHAGLQHTNAYLDIYVQNPAPPKFQAHFLLEKKEHSYA